MTLRYTLPKRIILNDMNMKGSVNEHYFEIEGEGKGKPNEEEYGSPIIGSLKEDPSHFSLTYCRQRSNMEIDASPNTLPTCPTFSNKHFLPECHMKRPLKSEDGGVAPAILF
ncbi:hypothetical protein pdam_00015365 [Pocillopora damicornis]|uniref:Uncharacterized protein n=1 Tax=Pocillopora damicornis TaxID=46731 RepID=A0A3M6V1G9_POCDA|nr:hypothetical protein pdam_00015365 [Pocillopora damicornis]